MSQTALMQQRYDPRVKIVATVLFIVATLVSESGWELLGLGLGLMVALMISKSLWKQVLRNILLISWFALFTLGAYVWGGMDSPQSLSMSLQAGGLAASRLVIVVGWGTWLGASTSPLTLVAALERVLQPLAHLGIPVHSLTLVAMLSVRFFPILFYEQQILIHASIARGIDVTTAPLRTRLRLYLLMCVPLFMHLLRRVEHLSFAMESRAFRPARARTLLWQPHLGIRDYVLITASVGMLLGIVCF